MSGCGMCNLLQYWSMNSAPCIKDSWCHCYSCSSPIGFNPKATGQGVQCCRPVIPSRTFIFSLHNQLSYVHIFTVFYVAILWFLNNVAVRNSYQVCFTMLLSKQRLNYLHCVINYYLKINNKPVSREYLFICNV